MEPFFCSKERARWALSPNKIIKIILEALHYQLHVSLR